MTCILLLSTVISKCALTVALIEVSTGYLVVNQCVCSGIRMRQSGNGLSCERIFSELRLIPAPALDASEAGAAFALRRVNLHNGRGCHARRGVLSSCLRPPHNKPTSFWLVFRTPLCTFPQSAVGLSCNILFHSCLIRKKRRKSLRSCRHSRSLRFGSLYVFTHSVDNQPAHN